MTFQKFILAATLVVAVAGCTSADRFGTGSGAGAGEDPFGTGGIDGGALNDPNSPAYFNQTIGDRVFFEVDQSTLSTDAQLILDQQAVWLTQNGAYNALIQGHADEQGTQEYNIALGERRAEAVRSYLVTRGVAPSRLQTFSYGKERPVAVCSDESCYSQNRRSVTVLAVGAGA